MEQKCFRTYDLYLSAFLKLKGIEPLLQQKDGIVEFFFDAFKIKDLMRLYENDQVNPFEFAQAIKNLKAQVYILKRAGKKCGSCAFKGKDQKSR